MEQSPDEIQALRYVTSLQKANCLKAKPWLKSTGPRTKVGKRKVTKNLPNQAEYTAQIVKNLKKIQATLGKIKRSKEKKNRQKLSKINRLEKLSKATEEKLNESQN